MMQPEEADVAIAGGGPAGSACAIDLARRGVRVVTIEPAVFPRAKTCGEYLNAGAVVALDALGAGAFARAEGQPVHALHMRDRRGSALSLAFCGESISLARSKLDAHLADLAGRAGARTIRGRVEGVHFESGRAAGLIYRDRAGECAVLRSRFVVGADGARSRVASALGLSRAPRGPQRFAIGGHFEGIDGAAGSLHMFVDGSRYLALNPLAGGQHNVMLVMIRAELAAARDDVDGFFFARGRALGGDVLDRARRSGPRLSFGPLASFTRGAWAPGALLAGDAAGMIDPFTGQGVFIALRSAAAAADALALALAAKTSVRADEALALYARTHGRDLAMRRAACAMVKTLIGTPALARLAAPKLARAPDRARPVFEAVSGVGAIERAFDPRVLARLVA